MKLRGFGFVVLASLVCTARSAWAIDIQNMDNRKYDVKFTATNSTATVVAAVDGNTTVANIFSGDGSLEVVGLGSLQVTSEDVIEIRNGRLTKRTS